MQLLTPQSVKKVADDRELLSRRTYADLTERVNEKRKELIALTEEYATIEKRQEAQLQANNNEIVVQNQTIARLQYEREELMKPVTHLEEKAKKELAELIKERRLLKDELLEAEETKEKLIKKIDSLDARKDVLNDWNDKLVKKEKGLKNEHEELKRMNAEVQERLKSLTESITKSNAEYALKDKDLTEREHALEVKQKALITERDDLEVRERALADRYATLERSIKRLNQ